MQILWPSPDVHIACWCSTIFGTICFLATPIAIIAYFKSLTIRQMYQNLLLLTLLVNAQVYSVSAVIFYGHGAIFKNSNILGISWACTIDGFVNVFCCCMEIYALMCISVERYFAITKQKPLSKNQIIGMIAFGVCWIGFFSSIALWHPSYFYTPTYGHYYCAYPFYDRTQFVPSLIVTLHCAACISITCFCYIQIYRYWKLLKRNVKSNMQSSIMTNNTQKRENNEELRILWTTVLLVGWTFLGWIPLLLLLAYEIIMGEPGHIWWEMIGTIFLSAAVCGDSIILLVYDARWKASVRDMVSGVSQRIRSTSMTSSYKASATNSKA